jgi:hypothetical protein
MRLQQGMAANPSVRHAFFRSDIALSAMRCLAFLATNIRLPHVYLRSDPASTSSSGVAGSLHGYETAAAAGDCFSDSPQYRFSILFNFYLLHLNCCLTNQSALMSFK